MEALELVYAAIQVCGCLAEVMAASSTVGAGVAGVKANQVRKKRKEAEARGEAPPVNNAAIVFCILLFIAIVLVGFVLFKYLGPAR